MSLISFHRGLIATAIVFCFGYAGWEIVSFTQEGGTGSLVVGGVFLVLGVGLGYYLARLMHFLGYEKSGKEPS
ncbi:MAG: hypothetical protein EXR92_02015 [Gemmatimonadetes bacterium]|nr:hypothetical protein [Gemmatimonadota bacterium]